jgi:hypothetical protein
MACGLEEETFDSAWPEFTRGGVEAMKQTVQVPLLYKLPRQDTSWQYFTPQVGHGSLPVA